MQNLETTEILANRETDKLIAEKIFGIKKIFCPSDVDELGYMNTSDDYHFIPSGKPPRTHLIDAQRIPNYSTDIAAAWQIVEQMSASTKEFWTLNYFSTGATVEFFYEGGRDRLWQVGNHEADAEDMPLAICRAALKAVSD